MTERRPLDRAALGRVLTRLAKGQPAALPDIAPADAAPARRIGFTGAPGAGKSTLVGRLALKRTRERRVGVLAIDPTSPRSGGAILGDRIRIDEIDETGELYVRSVASKSATDGLADQAPEMLTAMEAFGFDELVLETVGVGQVEHAVRQIVDTLVLVLPPDGGDHVQAMKAGIAELADIFVVNKSDVAGAQRMAADVKRVVAFAKRAPSAWVPPVLLTSMNDAASIVALSSTIDEHAAWLAKTDALPALQLARSRYGLARLVERLARRAVAEQDAAFFAQPVQQQVRHTLDLIAQRADPERRAVHPGDSP
jgi:LAO/AO transport system kinase